MRKLFILTISLIMMCSFTIQIANAASGNNELIKSAIEKYKAKNYIGCISDLRMFITNEPSSAIAWYYLGNSYMNVALKPEAHEAFDRVIQLNTVPKLTSYSIQAKICMEDPNKCQYQDFTYDQIKQLKADPTTFLEAYFASLNEDNRDESQIEIERLINGYYSNNIHPSAKEFIMQERAKMKQLEINASRSNKV